MTEGVLIALIVAGLGAVGSIINGYLHYKMNREKRLRNNPYPCKDHDTRIDQVEKDLGIVKNDVKYIRIEVTRIRDKQNGVR